MTWSEDLLENYPTLTQKDCEKVLRLHSLTLSDYLSDMGFSCRELYDTETLLGWLGY